jgi:hypothetical protein
VLGHVVAPVLLAQPPRHLLRRLGLIGNLYNNNVLGKIHRTLRAPRPARLLAVARAKRLALPFYLALRLVLASVRLIGQKLDGAHARIRDERYLRGLELRNLDE